MMHSIRKLINTPQGPAPTVPVQNTNLQDQEFEKELFIDPVGVPDGDLIIDPIDVVPIPVADIVVDVSGDDQPPHTVQEKYLSDGVIFYGCTKTFGTSESDVVLYDSEDVAHDCIIFLLLVARNYLLDTGNVLGVTRSFGAPKIKIPQPGLTNPLSSKRMNFEKWLNVWAEASGSTISMLSRAQGNSTALAIRKPAAALEAVHISAIPRLWKPTPSQKRPREGVTDDDFLPKKSRGDGTSSSPSPLTPSSGTHNTTPIAASGGLELPNPDSLDDEADELPDQAPLKRPAVQPHPKVNNTSPPTATSPQGVKEGVERQKEPEASPAIEKEVGVQKELEASSTMDREVEGQKDTETSQRRRERLRNNHSRRDSVPLQHLQPSMTWRYSSMDSGHKSPTWSLRSQPWKTKGGSLKAELVERESRISGLEISLHNAKQEGAHFSDLVVKQMGAKRLALQKLEKEKQTTRELQSRVGEPEKTISSHQEEMAAMTARAEALYEEGKVVFIDLTISDSSSDSSSLAFPSLEALTPELSSGPSIASEQSVTSPLPREENHPHLPQQVSGGVHPNSGVLPNGARTGVSSGCPDDNFPTSPAQSNDMAGLSPGEFSRLYLAPRLPATSPPSPPRLPSGRIDWDCMTLQDFALYQRMRRAKLGRSFLIVEAQPSRESRTASPNLLKSPNDGSSLGAPAPRPGTWEDYDIEEAADSVACPSSKRRSPWRGPHLLLV
ncbi:unnamed protein product [Cuscuta campestris]|uniref:Uncharacterized protein n=1 Tax=Cuscuta campestris TaxID=132261 RepID=A0A484LAD6_9ASTE|nr:unnamed protein product [Cuscuta campestris]